MAGGPTDRDGNAAPAGGPYRYRMDGLRWRVLVLLMVALLPIGLIAIDLSRISREEQVQRTELSLAALTSGAARHERDVLTRALGAAGALSAAIDLTTDATACRAYLARYVANSDIYTFAGVFDTTGVSICSSGAARIDLSGDPAFTAGPRAIVRAGPFERTDDAATVSVAEPIYEDGTFGGYVVLSIPRSIFASMDEPLDGIAGPLQLLTFGADGDIVSARGETSGGMVELPAPEDLVALVRSGVTVRTGEGVAGSRYRYVVSELIPGVANALGVWPAVEPGTFGARPWLIPTLLWLVSLVIAFLAIERLLLGNVRSLGTAMTRFGVDRRLPREVDHAAHVGELREISGTFRAMADRIVRDEAQMEDTLRERGVLLKEVHHRVKNNLQLISSIISMNMRRTKDQDVRAALLSVQDRVLGLATIHRSLYQSEDVGRLDTATLLRRIVEQRDVAGALGADGALALDLASVTLLPDQAVPLALLTSEALAEVTKVPVGTDAAARRVLVRFATDDAGTATLLVDADTGAPGPDPTDDVLSTGLVRAFSTQLGGETEIVRDGGRYRLQTRFPIEMDHPDARDF